MKDLARYRINQPGFDMELEFSCRSNGVTDIGTGHTANLNPAEAIVQTDRQLPRGGDIELRIAWPYLLQGVCPLELYITGWIKDSDEATTVVHIDWYEFRIRGGEHSFDSSSRKGATCDLVA